MTVMPNGAICAFLRGDGRDGRGRSLAEVLAFDDRQIEGVHDFIQWLFPLPEPSRAIPGSPLLGDAEAALIRGDAAAQSGVAKAAARMIRFYDTTDAWLTGFDHNHLRITRIILALNNLLGADAAMDFYEGVTRRNASAGSPVNAESLRHWQRALRRV